MYLHWLAVKLHHECQSEAVMFHEVAVMFHSLREKSQLLTDPRDVY